jgi:hypothetical protein
LEDPISQADIDALNRLLGCALVDPLVRGRLLNKEEAIFCTQYAISKSTWYWVKGLRFTSLQQFAQAVMCRIDPEEDMST